MDTLLVNVRTGLVFIETDPWKSTGYFTEMSGEVAKVFREDVLEWAQFMGF